MKVIGGLAQLARAPALHAGGQRFESVILHRVVITINQKRCIVLINGIRCIDYIYIFINERVH